MDAQKVPIAQKNQPAMYDNCEQTSNHLTIRSILCPSHLESPHSECRERMSFLRIIRPTRPPCPPWSRMNCPLETAASLLLPAGRSQVANAEQTPSYSLLQLDEINASQYGSLLKVESGNTSREFVQQIREVTKANRKLLGRVGEQKATIEIRGHLNYEKNQIRNQYYSGAYCFYQSTWIDGKGLYKTLFLSVGKNYVLFLIAECGFL